MTIVIRDERQGEAAAIAGVHHAAFGAEGEVALVDGIRADGDAVLSLVAVDGEVVAGHVLFSRMAAPKGTLALAPLAVLPRWQRQGVGSSLVREGLGRAASAGWQAVFVLGDPAYYGRFGFSADAARGFDSPYAGDHFMLLTLGRSDLPMAGQVRHASAFARL